MTRWSGTVVATALAGLLAACGTPTQPPARGCQGIDFEPPAVAGNSVFGAPTHAPGDRVIATPGLAMHLQNFLQPSGNTSFNRAVVDAARHGMGSGAALGVNNITLDFQVTGTVAYARFAYADLGGVENFSVNGSPVAVAELDTTPAMVGGVTVSVSHTAIVNAAGVTIGKRGVVALRGPIRRFAVGGQEFFIDDVCTNF